MSGIIFSENWERVIEALQSTDETVLTELEQGMQGAAELVRAAEATYPEQGNYHLQGPLPGGFFSQKQRRFFFAALRDGTISVPYQRTGALGAAWTSNVERSGNGVRGTVSNDAAPVIGLVMGDSGQARMFEGVWQRGVEIFHAQREAIVGILSDAAHRAIQKIGHG